MNSALGSRTILVLSAEPADILTVVFMLLSQGEDHRISHNSSRNELEKAVDLNAAKQTLTKHRGKRRLLIVNKEQGFIYVSSEEQVARRE